MVSNIEPKFLGNKQNRNQPIYIGLLEALVKFGREKINIIFIIKAELLYKQWLNGLNDAG